MMDEEMKPYAPFLEAICKFCTESQPKSACFVCETEDGTIYSNYFGEAVTDVFH